LVDSGRLAELSKPAGLVKKDYCGTDVINH